MVQFEEAAQIVFYAAGAFFGKENSRQKIVFKNKILLCSDWLRSGLPNQLIPVSNIETGVNDDLYVSNTSNVKYHLKLFNCGICGHLVRF